MGSSLANRGGAARHPLLLPHSCRENDGSRQEPFRYGACVLRTLASLALMLFAASSCVSDESPPPTATPPSESSPTANSPLPTLASAQPPAATPVPAVVDRLKADLAARLGVPAGGISVVTLEPFTWPDGCLGLGGPGVVCTQALVPGWLAVLRAPDGKEYRYRGSGDRFAIEP